MNITVKYLLELKRGYDRREAGEDILVDLNKATMSLLTKRNRTATTRDVIEYILAQPLQFTLGEKKSYSNYGYMLLGYLVNNATGMPYMDFLEKNFFRGLDVELCKTSPYEHRHDRIIQESRLTGLDPLRPMSNRPVAAVYGGYGAIMEECSAAFSHKASASTIAKFAGFHAVSGIGLRKNGCRPGDFEGARTHVESNGDFDFAVVLNTRDFAFD
ncbi:hypothetical protein FNYG_06283 [Fusarium nygamai]|uniref:Beta-lactamase-related domain-containing protein n=1 Tax=Gibberella nygamai TaxID=42673 RepID=A0A2K0WEJ4_GIBNY|nr:hypothetical protein FNYG_06283 [Fusarium nygamai]